MNSYRELDVEIMLSKRLKRACEAAGATLRINDNTREYAGLSPYRVLAKAYLKEKTADYHTAYARRPIPA